MSSTAQKIQGLRLEELALMRKLEDGREQQRLLAASESILQSNLSTVRAKLAGVALAEEAAREAAAVPAEPPGG